MNGKYVKLTKSQAVIIHNLLLKNKELGHYFGKQEQFEKRQNRLIRKFESLMNEKGSWKEDAIIMPGSSKLRKIIR